jgi:small-conductance mechanosensitive channel
MIQRRKYALRLVILLTLIVAAGLASSCDAGPSTPAVTGTIVPTITETQVADEATPPADPASETAPAPESGTEEIAEAVPGDVKEVATAVAKRTPEPTPTPSRVDREIDQITSELGISGTSFLGITAEDWIDLGISVLIVLAGYFLGTRLLTWILRWITNRTSTEIDENLVRKLTPDLKWLVVLFFTRFAVLRLDFLSDSFRKIMDDVFFGLGLVIFTIIVHRLISYGADWYKDNLESDEERLRLTPVILSFQRILDVVLLIIILSIGLSHFGLNIGALSITILVLALVLSLGAKDVISDAISGFVILLDQPFRIHDGIQIEEFGTWGDVVAIGTRTTRILTRDNREVIIPNTKILNSRIVNYTYPSPEVRMQVDLHIAYDSDLDNARRVIVDALRKVDIVLQEKDVEVLLIDFGDTARRIRVRWWVADYHQPWFKIDKVATAIDAALDQAGIEIPITVYDLNVRMESSQSITEEQTKLDE